MEPTVKQNRTKRILLAVAAVVVVGLLGWLIVGSLNNNTTQPEGSSQQVAQKESGYKQVNGLNMYYEVHGQQHEGMPIVLLHGAFMNIDMSFGALIPELSKTHKVIAIEQQGHGRTADIDRAFSYPQFADDTAALLTQLGVEKANLVGWSFGGSIASQVALRHPARVANVTLLGVGIGSAETTFTEQEYQTFKSIPDNFAPAPLIDAYEKMSPAPERWAQVVKKVRDGILAYQGIPVEERAKLTMPFMLLAGEKDVIRMEHLIAAKESLPKGALAIMPSTDHFGPQTNPQLVAAMVKSFLTPPPVQPGQ